jgi:peptide deformylase
MIKKSDLKIIPDNDPILLSPPSPWDFNGEEDAQMFSNILQDKMVELGGIGLSANQVGVSKKVFVIGMNEFKKTFFNPEIVETSKEEEAGEEGCLSFPGIFLQVKRPSDVVIKYQDEKGEWFTEEFKGLTARVILHEYDHMLGRVFKEKVSKLKWDMATKKKAKKIKRIIKQHVQKRLIDIQKQINQHGNNT